jgi:hypothetical protein
MKIAVNRCYGGFDMSNQAVKRYLELIGKECYFYKQTKYNYKDGVNEFSKCDISNKNSTFISVSTKDLGDKTKKIPDEYYFYYGDISRNDPALIQTIEELKECASGRFGNIQIVSIPDDINWEISNYDGIETVEEIHRSW